MSRLSVVLLCTVVAFSSAVPWYSNRYNSRASMQEGYFDSEGMYHRNMPLATIQQESGQTLCQSASHDNGGITTYVHICESGKDAASGAKNYCFISNGPCCILNSQSPSTPAKEFLLSLSSQSKFTVKFYGTSGVQGACYHLDEVVPVCTGCQNQSCVETSCIQNSATGRIDSCNESGCTCKEGFAPPDCCNCDLTGLSGRPHYLASDGTCKPLCSDFCAVPLTIDGCSQCRTGYKKPDCCECDVGYYRAEDGTCKRPCTTGVTSCSGGVCTCAAAYTGPDCCQCKPGYYKSTDGTCKSPCTTGVISCSGGVCTCAAAYTGPDCCQCKPGYYKSTDGTCKSPCTTGVTSCLNGVCTCAPAYTGPDCCQCKPGYYKATDGTCKSPCTTGVTSCLNGVCTCAAAYTGPDCCQCKPDYYRANDGTCKSPCTTGVTSCSGGVCTCAAAYTGPDCCQCKPGYYRATDGTCKNPCTTGVTICSNGVCTCAAAYTGRDCCQCKPGYYRATDGTCKSPCTTGVTSCSGGVCTCAAAYTGRDCCQCKPGYYKATDGTCKKPCDNIVSCNNGVCTCKSPFIGADCCDEPKCDAVQDIYFVIDATVSNNRLAFCQTHYGVELMITAMNPTGSLDGTRIGAVFYPKTAIGQTPVTTHVNFFDLGTDCTKAVGNYNTMIDGFYNTEFDNPYKNSLRSATTHPAPSLEVVAAKIRAAGLPTRRRIVVVITDGNNDGSSTDLSDAVINLAGSASSVTIIAAGNDNAYRNEPAFEQQFEQELTTIANGNSSNVVINRTSTGLAIDLVEKMRSIGAICKEQADDILKKLQSDTDSLTHCHCIDSRGPNSGDLANKRCKQYCKLPLYPRDCRSPPTCSAALAFGATIQGNPYYDSSDGYDRAVAAEYNQPINNNKYNQPINNNKDELERDILAAVEEVLRERMDG